MKKPPPPPRRASPLDAPHETDPRIGSGLAAAAYLLLALVYFLPAFLPGRHIFGTDYTLSSFFYLDFISDRIAAGSVPGWIPHVYGGLPLFSNPGSTYYPIRWIADLLGPTRTLFPFIFWFQFFVAGWGMYLLARELRCRSWIAFVVGLAFQWTGILTSWVYAGHDGRIIVVSLAPLLFACLHRGIRTGRVAPFAGAAATVGFALLSFQIQNAYYLLLSAAIFSVFTLLVHGVHREPARLGRTVGLGIAAVAFGFVLAAVNFLPFRDYVSESPRGMTGGRGYTYSTSFSMPLRAIVGVAVPEQVGANIQNDRGEYVLPIYRGANAFRLHSEYLGALVLVLVALGGWYSRRDRYWWFFGGLGLFALSLSLGGNTPLYRLYYEILPGLKRFRAPDLAYYVLALSLITMAALTFERIAALRDDRAGRRGVDGEAAGPLPLIAGGVVLAAVLGALLLGGPSAEMAAGTVGLTPAQGWMRFAAFAAMISGVLWAWHRRSLPSMAALPLLAVLTVADLWVVGKRFFMTLDPPEVTYAEDEITAFLRAQPGPVRFWAPEGQSAWPTFKNQPMWYGLENAAGEHGNQLQRYNEFAGAGTEVYVDFHNFADARFLAAADIRWIVISAELEIPWLREAYRGRQAIVYENLLALPRARIVPAVVPVAEGGALAAMRDTLWDPSVTAFVEGGPLPALPAGAADGSAEIVARDPDRVVVRTTADRDALLVLADNWYKDWHATVDGRAVPVLLTNHTFRGVVVPAGTHTVEFEFRSGELMTGLYIHLAAMAVLLLYGLWLLVVRVRAGRAGAAGAAPAER
jgi:hypothetical protein